MAVVYRHRRLDTNEIFYIGIGVSKRRAFQKRSRNPFWHNVVNKTEYKVEIIIEDIDYKYAEELEIYYIEEYGRRDLEKGSLVNMTNGGDGFKGMSQETKDKISQSLTGIKHSEYTKEKLKKSLIEVWKNPILRELKRVQTTELNKLGLIGTKGKISKMKGIPRINEHKENISKSLKKYYENNNKPHNFIEIDIEIKNNIWIDYCNGTKAFQLHKKYNFHRNVIHRILKEYDIIKNNM